MSWQDRPYSGQPAPEFRLNFRRPSSAVTWLIIANVAVFFLDTLSQNFLGGATHRLFGLSLDGVTSLFLWQPVSYMFIHASVMHVLVNMLMVYICGTEFERAFGTQRFIRFYFLCGIVGGLAYLGLALLRPDYAARPLVGASGAGYGLLLAAIVFFPHIQVILFIIPMPIRVFGLIVLGILALQLIGPGGVENLGGEVCHLAGAGAALVTIKFWGLGRRPAFDEPAERSWTPGSFTKRQRRAHGAWERKQKKLAAESAEVDRILAKVHNHGLASLNRSEKKILAKATQRQQSDDRQLGRIDRL